MNDSILAYEMYLKNYPNARFGDRARTRLAAMNLDRPDWEKALKKHSIEGYVQFLKSHPKSAFAEKARGMIVDLEVSDIMRGKHGELPSPTRTSEDPGRTYSIVRIHNDTKYNLTIRYSGPESFKAAFSADEKGAIELLRGQYRVAASVDASSVQNYAGTMKSEGGEYQSQFYIQSTGPSGFSLPRHFQGSSSSGPWPTKRSVPDFLK